MELAQPVYHPASDDIILLNTDYVLDRKVIGRLHDFEVGNIWIKVPGLEELDGKVASAAISQSHAELLHLLNGTVAKLEQRVAVKVNLQQYKKAVRQMLTEMVANPSHDAITHQLSSCGPWLSGHFTNTCYLSLLIGAHMTGYLRKERSTLPPDIAENTASLGMGGLLHDMGKLYMDDDMQHIHILCEDADLPEYRFHVRAGHEEVREHVSVLVANVIFNHHQRFDGTGFPARKKRTSPAPPQPLAGRDIHIFSRIVSVVDTFDHLLCPDGSIVPTIVAIQALKSEGFRGWFDPVVVETLLRLVPPFMIGSIVMLSDGTEAVVMANHPEAPCRPSVKLLNGPICNCNTRTRGKQLDLRMCRNLTVAAINDFDVRPYLFTGELEPEGEMAAV